MLHEINLLLDNLNTIINNPNTTPAEKSAIIYVRNAYSYFIKSLLDPDNLSKLPNSQVNLVTNKITELKKLSSIIEVFGNLSLLDMLNDELLQKSNKLETYISEMSTAEKNELKQKFNVKKDTSVEATLSAAIRDYKYENFENALDKFKEIIQRFEINQAQDMSSTLSKIDLKHRGLAYFYLGNIYQIKREWLAAITAFKSMLEDFMSEAMRTTYPEINQYIATAYYGAGICAQTYASTQWNSPDNAIKYYKKSIKSLSKIDHRMLAHLEIDQDSINKIINESKKGLVKEYHSRGNYDAMFAILETLSELDNDEFEFFFGTKIELGMKYINDDPHNALACFEIALELYKKYPTYAALIPDRLVNLHRQAAECNLRIFKADQKTSELAFLAKAIDYNQKALNLIGKISKSSERDFLKFQTYFDLAHSTFALAMIDAKNPNQSHIFTSLAYSMRALQKLNKLSDVYFNIYDGYLWRLKCLSGIAQQYVQLAAIALSSKSLELSLIYLLEAKRITDERTYHNDTNKIHSLYDVEQLYINRMQMKYNITEHLYLLAKSYAELPMPQYDYALELLEDAKVYSQKALGVFQRRELALTMLSELNEDDNYSKDYIECKTKHTALLENIDAAIRDINNKMPSKTEQQAHSTIKFFKHLNNPALKDEVDESALSKFMRK